MDQTKEICFSFNRHANEYEQAAKVQAEIGERLFERLQYLKIQPRFILDLGCGTGLFSSRLKKHYPYAQVIGLDIAENMLSQAQKKQRWRKKWALVASDMAALPFPNGLFDLVYTNQVIHWSESLSTVMSELNRIMSPGGCLMFSTLGPDTFKELRLAWQKADQFAHTNEFVDMHDLGDLLMSEFFIDPVVDMEMLTVHYDSLKKLIRNLKAQGVRNINTARKTGLTGKTSWKTFADAMHHLSETTGQFPLTYEVIYGHAWKGEKSRLKEGVESFFPIERLRLHK